MLGVKFNHVSKGGPWCMVNAVEDLYTNGILPTRGICSVASKRNYNAAIEP